MLRSIAQHWMLSLAVEYRVPMRLLFPTLDGDSLNVRPIPGFAVHDYASCVRELVKMGMIVVSDPESGGQADVEEVLGHLIAAVPGAGSLQATFELTEQGGRTWEALACPDWSRFLLVSSDLKSAEIISPDRNVLMAYMGWFEEIDHRSIIRETVEITVETDFPVFYWKRLPCTFRASFKLIEAEPRRGFESPSWFREWESEIATWHRQAWDLPDWPSPGV